MSVEDPSTEPRVFVGIGSNLGNRTKNLDRALNTLEKKVDLQTRSSVLETEPYKINTENRFLNQVIEIDPGDLGPKELLGELLEVESQLGRTRSSDSRDRVIDLDLLYYDQRVYHSPDLDVPHPEVHRRSFVLKSMVELNPVFLHPELNKTQTELLVNALKEPPEN